MSNWYVEDPPGSGAIRPAKSLREADDYMGNHSARVVANNVVDGVRVSTVFLCLDHRYGDGPPLLYETMIFEGEHDGDQWRCSTRAEAVEQHAKALAMIGGAS